VKDFYREYFAMPMETIDKALITQFSDNMHVVAQQTKARMRPYAVVLPIKGDRFAYDGLGDVEARELTGRFNQTQFDDIEFFRRKIVRRRFVVTLPIDEMDVEAMMTEPTSKLAEACTRAMERVFDRIYAEALFADVATGRDFETTVTFASDGGLTVDATGGLTLAKMLAVQQNWIDGEVGNDMPVQKALGISGGENTTLLQLATLTSRDYTNNMQLDDGEIKKAVGMTLVKFGASARKPVLSVSAGVRSCFAVATGAVAVGVARGWRVTIKDRPDYVDTKQIQVTGILGAVRTEGKLVQKVTTTV
jgi:hypothetical protein